MPNAGGLWARVRLSGRKASRWRFQLTVVNCTFRLHGHSAKRPPHRLSVLITRKKRKCRSSAFNWHVSDPKNPKNGNVALTNTQDPIEFESTLNTTTFLEDSSYEDKRWSIVLEEVTKSGQRKPLAQGKINLADIVDNTIDEKFFKEIQNIVLKGYKDRIHNVFISVHLAGILLKTGEATDEDLQSLASLLSTSTLDIGNLDDFSDSISENSSGFLNDNLAELNKFTNELKTMTDNLSGGSIFKEGDSIKSFETELSEGHYADDFRQCQTLPRNFERTTEASTPPSKRKLRPSLLEFAKTDDKDEDEETVGGVAQELLTWVRSETKDIDNINVTNLTSSFRSGVTFGMLLHRFSPQSIDISELNPRTSKANLKCALECYKKAGLDLYGIINVNEMASKPDKLAVITALHKIRFKFADSGNSVQLRKKKASENVDRKSIHSVLFDSKATWSSIAEFRIETLLEEIRRLETEPDYFSEQVDEILDALEDSDFDEDFNEPPPQLTPEDENKVSIMKAEIEITRKLVEVENNRINDLSNDETSTIQEVEVIEELYSNNNRQLDDTKEDDAKFRDSLIESIEINELLELERQVTEELLETVDSDTQEEQYEEDEATPTLKLSSDEDVDEMSLMNRYVAGVWGKRLSTVGEVEEDDLEDLQPMSDHFATLQRIRAQALSSVQEDSEDSDVEFLKLELEVKKSLEFALDSESEDEVIIRDEVFEETHSSQSSPVSNIAISINNQHVPIKPGTNECSNTAEKVEKSLIEEKLLTDDKLICENSSNEFALPEFPIEQPLKYEKPDEQKPATKITEQLTENVPETTEMNANSERSFHNQSSALDEYQFEGPMESVPELDLINERELLAIEKQVAEEKQRLLQANKILKVSSLDKTVVPNSEVDDIFSHPNSLAQTIIPTTENIESQHSVELPVENIPLELPEENSVQTDDVLSSRENTDVSTDEEIDSHDTEAVQKLPIHDTEIEIEADLDAIPEEILVMVRDYVPDEEIIATINFESGQRTPEVNVTDQAVENEIICNERKASIVSVGSNIDLNVPEERPSNANDEHVSQQALEYRTENDKQETINITTDEQRDQVVSGEVDSATEETISITEISSKYETLNVGDRTSSISTESNTEIINLMVDDKVPNEKPTVETFDYSDNQLQTGKTVLSDSTEKADQWTHSSSGSHSERTVSMRTPTCLDSKRNSTGQQGLFDSDSSSDEDVLKSKILDEEQQKFEEKKERWLLLLKDLSNQCIRIIDEQDDVDDRAQQVEPDLRRAIQMKNTKLESDLTAEWLALIQKRDNLLHQAERLSKEKKRAKLELEHSEIQFEARKLSMIDPYKKTQIHREQEDELLIKCMKLVEDKNQIDEEIDSLDAEIISQRERHAVQMQQNLIEQKRKAEETSSYSLGRMKNWMGFG